MNGRTLQVDELFGDGVSGDLVQVGAAETVEGRLLPAVGDVGRDVRDLRHVVGQVEDSTRACHPGVGLVHGESGDDDLVCGCPGQTRLIYGRRDVAPDGDICSAGVNGLDSDVLVPRHVEEDGADWIAVVGAGRKRQVLGDIYTLSQDFARTQLRPAVPDVVLNPFYLCVVEDEVREPAEILEQVGVPVRHVDEQVVYPADLDVGVNLCWSTRRHTSPAEGCDVSITTQHSREYGAVRILVEDLTVSNEGKHFIHGLLHRPQEERSCPCRKTDTKLLAPDGAGEVPPANMVAGGNAAHRGCDG